MLRTALRPLAGHPAYDYRLTVSIPYNARDDGMPASTEDYERACELGDRLTEELRKGQQSLLALTVMTQGRRDLVFYTARAGAALIRLEDARKALSGAQFKSVIERDTFWGRFRTFLDASEEKEEE